MRDLIEHIQEPVQMSSTFMKVSINFHIINWQRKLILILSLKQNTTAEIYYPFIIVTSEKNITLYIKLSITIQHAGKFTKLCVF